MLVDLSVFSFLKTKQRCCGAARAGTRGLPPRVSRLLLFSLEKEEGAASATAPPTRMRARPATAQRSGARAHSAGAARRDPAAHSRSGAPPSHHRHHRDESFESRHRAPARPRAGPLITGPQPPAPEKEAPLARRALRTHEPARVFLRRGEGGGEAGGETGRADTRARGPPSVRTGPPRGEQRAERRRAPLPRGRPRGA